MSVVHEDHGVFRKDGEVLREGGGGAVVGKHAISQQNNFCVGTAARDRALEVVRMAMFELQDGAIEEPARIGQRGVRTLIHQRVGKVAGQRENVKIRSTNA